ncbi:hypothetical protein H9Q74_000234 [Fusarium xylarioides]|nr:hypothetical protein H9Q71_001204 [Fusarium xylarioides]KAG5829715.1 hypothetical protein H9Q74_000234 [Fusarium xylarioides]
MPAESTPTRVRRRATEACTFCRKRKIKCNGQKPKCINCQTYEKDRVYEPVPDVTKAAGRQRHQRTKTRSVKARTESPARQTSAPAASSNGDSEAASSSIQQAVTTRDGAAQPRHQSWDPSPRPMDSGVARVVVLANGESTYHGRTSALFEDNAQERPVEQEVQPRMPDHWVERGLIAEAAKQRQLEEIHFAKGQLDFDGVDPDLGMHLLSLHWNRQHHLFLITYRPAFMRDMACGGPYFSKLLLNAIYFGSSKFSPRLEVRKDVNDVRTAGWRYRERVRELVGGSLDRSDITTIQALLVMTNSLFALGDERSAAWLYAGLAFRMLIDLGLHVDLTNSHQFSDEDLEIRRRVFWGAFVVDKIQSLYQGRSAQTETSPNQEMQPVELSGSAVPSPGSDWINIDGIIQSFLREGDFNGSNEPTMYGQYPQKIPQVDGEHYLHTSTGQQPVYFPQGFPAGGLNSFASPPVPGAGDIEGGNSWQQTSFWPANQDAAFMEDPIFGFNGSSTGEFQFMGR